MIPLTKKRKIGEVEGFKIPEQLVLCKNCKKYFENNEILNEHQKKMHPPQQSKEYIRSFINY
jgi:hypothetical protein